MASCAVIIPTIGIIKTKKQLSDRDQARLWGKMIRQVMANSFSSVHPLPSRWKKGSKGRLRRFQTGLRNPRRSRK